MVSPWFATLMTQRAQRFFGSHVSLLSQLMYGNYKSMSISVSLRVILNEVKDHFTTVHLSVRLSCLHLILHFVQDDRDRDALCR